MNHFNHSKYIYTVKQKVFKKLNLFKSNEIRLYFFKKYFYKLGWIYKKNFFFINTSFILFLIRKGLSLSILEKKINNKLKSFNFVYSLSILLIKWYRNHKLFLIPFYYFKKFIKILNFNFNKILLKKINIKFENLLIKRWKNLL